MLSAELIARAVERLPSLSTAAQQLLLMVDGDPEVRMGEVVALVENDPGMLANALRLANTTVYAGARRIGDAQAAVQRIGLTGLRELAVVSLVASALRGREREILGYRITGAAFLRHSIAAGTYARRLAETVAPALASQAFTAGALHDIGKLVVDTLLRQYPSLRQRAAAADRPLVEVEGAVIGADHARIGGAIAAHWRLPADIAKAISVHHEEPVALAKHGPLAALVAVANAFAHWYGYGAGAHQVFSTRSLCSQVIGSLGTTVDALDAAAQLALNQVRQAATGLGGVVAHEQDVAVS